MPDALKWTVIRTFYGGRTLTREFRTYTEACAFYFRAKRESTIRGATLWEQDEPLLSFGSNAPKQGEARRGGPRSGEARQGDGA